jgi:hypothetical protein
LNRAASANIGVFRYSPEGFLYISVLGLEEQQGTVSKVAIDVLPFSLGLEFDMGLRGFFGKTKLANI